MSMFNAYAAYRLDQPRPWLVRFEDEGVKMLLIRFRLRKHLTDVLDASEYQTGSRRLTFPGFRAVFPTFPVLLRASYRARVAERCRPANLFHAFEDVFLFTDYLEAFARHGEEAAGRPIGVVVPFDRYRGGMVVHNGAFDTGGTRIVHDVPDDLPPHRLTVEPYDAFIRCLARGGWTPGRPASEVYRTHTALPEPGMPVTRTMVERLGTSPALVVFGWLVAVMQAPSADSRRFLRRVSDTERCVVASHEEIAAAVGLSPRRVKRGLAALRNEGMVTTTVRRGRSHVRLVADGLREVGITIGTAP